MTCQIKFGESLVGNRCTLGTLGCITNHEASEMRKRVFRVEAMGDTIYVEALVEVEAHAVVKKHMGDIPPELLTFTGPMDLPEGEEALS